MTRRGLLFQLFRPAPDDIALSRRLADLLATVRRHPLRVFILRDALGMARERALEE